MNVDDQNLSKIQSCMASKTKVIKEEDLYQSQSNLNIEASEYNERINELMETDKTFKYDYDFLPPFDQTKIKSDENRSF